MKKTKPIEPDTTTPEGKALGIPCPVCQLVDHYRHTSCEKRPDGTIYRVKDCLCGNRFATIEQAAENLPITRRGPYNLKKNVT